MNKSGLLLFLMIVYLGSVVTAQIGTKMNLSFEEKVPAWMAENNVPCVGIGIIENGKIIYAKVFGEIKKNVPAPMNTIFNIASITKPVVALVTLRLVGSVQWNLDEPLDKYWIDPDVANDTLLKKLTTRHVLSHQSGFPNWRAYNKLKFEFEPGTKFQYSGEGFEYLRRALEHKFNTSLAELSDSVLFKTIGMNDTYYTWNDTIKNTRFAFGHDSRGNMYKGQNWANSNAAASLLTTIEDFNKFMIYVMNGGGLSPNLYNDMIHPQVTVKEHAAKGLGWGIVSDLPNGEYALEHGGTNPGFHTIAITLPKSKRGIVVFTNGDNGVFVYNNIIAESVEWGQDFLNITQSSYSAPIIQLSHEILDRYIGSYTRSDVKGYLLKVTREGSELTMSGDAVPLIRLFAEAENKLFSKGLSFQYEFVKDENNAVIKLNIYEKGKLLLDAKKIR